VLDKRFLDELRSRVTLSEVISRRVKLTRAGREFKACCPFHNEKSPSFYVNDAKGFFHCFGCGAHGDAVSFRMRHDNTSFMEAVESLASEAGMVLPAPDPQAQEHYDELQRLQQILDRVAKWFETQLRAPQNGFALRYVHERGLTDETIAQFRLGYAPNNWDAFREAMVAQDIKIEDLMNLGLLRQSTREDKADKKPYSFFRGRVMFPVTDAKGRVIAFGGRHLDAAFAGQTLTEKPPKYINSAEHMLFNKSGVLYGLARARASVSATAPLILVEGYMDVIALAQAGFATAVAPLGTALTEEHMQLAWRVSPPEGTPILCFDGDNAGLNAAYRAIDRILPHLTAQRGLRLVFLPQGEDPDSLIRNKGVDAMKKLLDGAIGVFDAVWDRGLRETPGTPEGRAQLQSKMEAQIKLVADPLLQQSYRQALRERLYQMGRQSFTPSKGGKWTGKQTPKPIAVPIQKLGRGQELRSWQVLIIAAINHPFLLTQQAEKLANMVVPDPDLDRLRETLLAVAQDWPENTVMTSESLKQSLSDRGLNSILASLNQTAIDQLYGFAKPDASAELVAEGWKDVWMRMQLKTVAQDKNKLLQTVRTTYSDETADRLVALSQQEQLLLDDSF
jgi:DNA primase